MIRFITNTSPLGGCTALGVASVPKAHSTRHRAWTGGETPESMPSTPTPARTRRRYEPRAESTTAPPAVIQRLAPHLPVERLLLLVRSRDYGSEGVEPVDDRECPYYQHYGSATSCVSGSGGSLCGGFYGTTADGYTHCGGLPRWTLPGQTVVVMAEDTPDPGRPLAGGN